MKKHGLIILFHFIGLSIFAQAKMEFECSASHSIFIQNKLAGTSIKYEDFGPYSSINLKCSKIGALNFGLVRKIGKSNWFVSAGYNRRWMNYTGTIYRLIYNPETPDNGREAVELTNLVNEYKIGGGYRFTFFASKMEVRPYLNLFYRSFRDEQLNTLKQVDEHNLEIGDFAYHVSLNNAQYNKKLDFETGLKLYFRLKPALKLFLDFSVAPPIQTIYESFQTEVVSKIYNNQLGITWIEVNGNNSGPFRIKTTNMNFGAGINFDLK